MQVEGRRLQSGCPEDSRGDAGEALQGHGRGAHCLQLSGKGG